MSRERLPTLTGDLDVRGALGVDPGPRNGFERIGVSFRVSGDASEERLREVVERARARSEVYVLVLRDRGYVFRRPPQ